MSRALRYLPALLFVSVYTGTCVIGALLLMSGYGPFIRLFEYFTGTHPPTLRGHALVVELVLLFIAPAVFLVAYCLAVEVRRPSPIAAELPSAARRAVPSWLPYLAFGAVFARACVDLVAAGGVAHISAWFNYAAWVEARQHTFQHIGFFGFANIYLFMPVAAAWAILSPPARTIVLVYGDRSLRIAWTRILPAVLTLGVSLLLFQKKTPVVSMLIIGMAVLLERRRSVRTQLTRRNLAVVVIGALAVYFALVVIPVYREASGAPPAAIGGGTSHVPVVALYAALAPLTRTSAPALYYPVVYPARHAFYGPDVGLDILGYGNSPDDNLVIWHAMNPTTAGTSAAPFQFPLYSQMGTAGAVAGAAALGLLLGLAWRLVQRPSWPAPWGSIAASLVLLLSIYIAIDSLRNSVVVSYGVLWGFIFIAVARAAEAVVARFSTPSQPAGSPRAARPA